MGAGTIFVYGRAGIGSSSAGSDQIGGPLDTGHVFLTVRDNRTNEQIDVDVWLREDTEGFEGEMIVNGKVTQERREQFDMVAFDVDGQTIDRVMDAAARFHDTSQPYEFFHYNCTDAVEDILRQTDLPIPDKLFPAEVFNFVKEMGEGGDLDEFRSRQCEPPPDISNPGGGNGDDDDDDPHR